MTIQSSSSTFRHPKPDPEILLREAVHRASNDLQMVVGLLALQKERAIGHETRDALSDAITRVTAIARARVAMQHSQNSLTAVLMQLCEALRAHGEPRMIQIKCDLHDELYMTSATHVSTIAIIVNELAINAIKHAFEPNAPGMVTIAASRDANGTIRIFVADDGIAFQRPELTNSGLGLGLISQLAQSIDALLILPVDDRKRFEIRITPTGI